MLILLTLDLSFTPSSHHPHPFLKLLTSDLDNPLQYIPVSIYDLQAWMGTPSVYVWDCHSAGTIVKNFKRFALDHNVAYLQAVNDPKNEFYNREPPNFNECIQLAACDENELLPTDPDLPADLFTSCRK